MQSIYPVLKYEDARSAIDFLERAFGFERHAVYDGENGGVAHAELRLGDEYVMLGSTGEGDDRFNQGAGRYSLYVVRHVSAGGRRLGRLGSAGPALTAAVKGSVFVDRPN